MLRIRDLILPETHDVSELYYHAAQALHVRTSEIAALHIFRRSLDARKKPDLRWVYTVDVTLRSGEGAVLRRCRSAKITREASYVYRIPRCTAAERPVVVGFGPAGMFAALVLAKAGLRPLVLERGDPAPLRREKVERFWGGGPLDPESNVQFGEGGAGAFSDGKLNTGTRDLRHRYIMEQLVACGAPESILTDALPHVGTDKLHIALRNLRQQLLDAGADIRFGARLEGFTAQDGALTAITCRQGDSLYTIPAQRLILALGHSARDTFETLYGSGLAMEPKPFAMGVRIEHRQSAVDAARYRQLAGHPALPPATYKLSCHLPNGRSAFSFCVCPGGQVVAAASEEQRVVTNGMSEYARDRENINGALLVNVTPADFPDGHPLAGIRLQRQLEDAAFALGGGDYRAPCQRVGDFLAGRPSTGAGTVQPSYLPGVTYTDLRRCLPAFISETLALALPELGRKLRGYDDPDALLTGIETRSSSPVRLVRDDRYESNIRGIYPCGEGAGYAGGILSAAADGMRCAEKLLEVYR